ncbi:DNA phosphorothioation-dependent restriction protein DptH [Vibrio sp. DW001]|uniref:DNA phosphorothioation-dependent restriction protein DptH n=1 Tax=Vibrio sp. DW001 TaxID=2912315 RepID=UPI0023B180FA|nr:DNA phosphorothioation-dependent restriction protein DptH [Vibrio sp. DW001]WED25451.1 DNA phosphorothioation-dependent restriction protein DptH [Vibrio sp. DW001]
MSEKQFEIFLTEQFLKLNETKLQHGYRYQFQSPNNKNSLRLYNAFIEKSDDQITIKNTTIRALKCGNTKLLPVLHNENGSGYSENFISHLRDEVAGQQGDFKGCALLVIHNSMLDTLINSAEDIAQVSSVWHPEKIKDALKSLIDPHAKDRKVSECLLDHRFAQIVEDGATMFGFEELYKAILDGDLQFHELGLLDDPEILNWSGKPEQINNRLEENKKLFDRINTVTERFSTELEEKFAENDFSDKFVAKHFSDEKLENWKTNLTFADCLDEKKRNVSNVLELESIDLQQIGKPAKKSKSDNKAGKRELHIILPLQPTQQSFDLSLTFLGGKIEKNQLKLQHTKDPSIEIQQPNNSGGKRSKVTVTGAFTGEPTYFSLILKRDKTAECYKFRVLVLTAESFYLPAFENIFLIEPSKKRITLQTEDNSFVIAEQGNKAKLEQTGQRFDNQDIKEIDFEALANESNDIIFEVASPRGCLTFNVEGAVASDSLSLPLMLDTEHFVHLFKDNNYACFNRKKNKVLLDYKEVAPKGRRLTLLQREADFLDKQLLNHHVDPQNSVELKAIEVDFPEIYLAYQQLFEYCTVNKTLPSLSSWGGEFREIVSELVEAYNEAIAAIGYDVMLTKSERLLVNIGYALYQENEEYREYITPLHPLVLAYHLSLATAIVMDNSNDNSSFKTLPNVTLDRLNARGLLPFVYHPKHEFAFTKLEKDNCMWLELVPHQETSYNYVRKLVKDKVTEFKDAFSSLFTAGSKATLIINSVNNHKNVELFMGLVDYVKTQKDKVCHIHVNLYDDKETRCEFDRFAETASYDELKSLYSLDKGAIREQADAIIDLLRTRLTYSKFRNDECKTKPQAYAHLSFFRNHHKVEPTDVNVLEEISGVVCHGLLAGEAADSKEESYFTAFGLKNVTTDNNAHLSMARRLNGLIKPARKANVQHGRANSLALAVSDDFKTLLERSYDNSIWTTIIDPKVTLDFFESAKDMVLIHYSDNYTNSTNYDAITVTKETDLYKKVLEQDEGGIIEEFNAFNGEWLLKMITANSNERKEKKGIIGAYKYINCLLAKSDITWVPLSVAEMVRVAGNIGLKMNDSDFSRNVHGYKSGAISDDVLFVGFKGNQLYLLPLEVKAGLKQTHKKGVEQAKELKRYLTQDILGRDDLAGHLYRGLFIRQILMQVDKYKLYNLYQPDYFNPLLKQREWWLQGDYQIAELQDYPEGFLVAMVDNDTFFEASFEEVQNILKIQLPSANLNHLVSTPLAELMADACSDTLSKIPEQYLLAKTISKKAVTSSPVENGNVSGSTKINTEEASVKIDNTNEIKSKVKAVDSLDKYNPNDNLKVLVGHNVRDDEAVFWEPTNTAKFMNTNSGIIGTMGTGKTQCTKAVVTQLYRDQHKNVDGSPIGILIFDYKSDYVDDKFINATNADKFDLDCLPYNPLSLFGDKAKLPVHTASAFANTMTQAFGLGPKQQMRLKNLVLDAYELKGIDRTDKNTWSIPAPTLSDVWDVYMGQDKVEQDSLYAALDSLVSFEIFEPDASKVKSLYGLIEGVTVIELAGYDSSIQNLVVALTLDLFYSQMQKNGKPEVQGDFRQVTKLVLVDEADNFMSQNFPSLRKILKEGREYGVGVILSTQDITHFKTSENDYSSYVLSWIVHRVSQIKNQDIKSIFNKDDKHEQENLMKSIRELDKHYSLYVDGDKKITKIKDKAFWELLKDE